jgi:amino acid adenylation domain-containing protein
MLQRTSAEFLSYLRSLDIRVSADGERLGCSAPKGVLTAELRAELVRRKAELLEFLRAAGSEGSNAHEIRRIDRGGDLPLSRGQQRLWFLDQLEGNGGAYNITFALELTGSLDVPALEASLREIYRRHEVLRTRLVNADGQPKAIIVQGGDWHLRILNARDVQESHRGHLIDQLAKEEGRRKFDLAGGELLRATLLEFGDRDYVLLVAIHHIAADGWSLGILVREFAQLYTAFREGRPSPLAELPLQYVDFAAWQSEGLESGAMQAQLAYWRHQLQAPLPLVELPTDRPRPSRPTLRGARRRFELNGQLAECIRQFSRAEEATVFMTLLAAFNVLLHRYTRLDDLVVGSAIAGRGRPELEDLIGLFINNLALRTNLSGDPTVSELIARTKETSLNAFAHQDLPFDRLVAALQPDRNLSHSPLFQVMFILQNFPARCFPLPGLSVKPLEVDPGTSRFDLTVEAAEKDDGAMALDLEYNADLFDETTIRRLARHYENLLAAMVADPRQRISELQMFGDEELAALVSVGEQTRAEYPRELCIHELIDRQAGETPDRVAVVCGDREIRYAELIRRSNRIANLLRELGVGRDALVGVCLERSIDMVAAVLGVLKAGAAYVPMDPQFPRERLAFMAEDTKLAVLVTEEKLRGVVSAPGATVLSLDGDADRISRQSEQAPENAASPRSLAYVIYTSGSTGKPKGVQIEHRSVVNFLESMRREPGLAAGDRLLSVTTLSFDIAGLEIYLPLIAGATIVLATRAAAADGQALQRLLQDSGATVMQATPATWRLLLSAGWTGQKGLRILCGGEAFPRELANRLLDCAAEVWNLYGPTETTIWSTLHKVERGDDAIPIGKPIANTHVHLLDENRQPVPLGVAGELHIGGDGLARGYLNRPELSAEKFVPHPFLPGERLYRTGDLARLLPSGALQFLGRMDQQVKIRGFRVELGEIESALERCTGVLHAVAVLREDTPGDQRVVAYVTPRPGAGLSSEALRGELLEMLPDYMVPSAFVALKSFPLTPNRKVDRRALPAPGPDVLQGAGYAPPTTEAEHGIAAVWKKLLKRDRVGIHDNFFDLGGHSLLLVQLQSHLRRQFEREISVLELFQKPTVAAIAEYLTDHASHGAPAGGERLAVAGRVAHE